MSANAVIPPFTLLLNSICNDLSRQNLQSLIHICEGYIPESNREGIKNALDVFRILKHQNVIGDDEEKVHNLEHIVKAMRPKRRDIIKKVRDFIRTNYDPGCDFQSSGESHAFNESAILVDHHYQPPRPPPALHRYNSAGLDSLSGQPSTSVEITSSGTENHCALDCCCCGFKCYARRIPSCVLLLLAGIMAMLTFLSILLWFGKIPDNLYKKMGSNGSKAGGYVVGFLGVATMVCLSWWIYRKVYGNRHVCQVPYQRLTSDVRPPVVVDDNQMEKDSTIPPSSVRLPIKKQKKRPFGSVTAESSLDTATSASGLQRQQQPQRGFPSRRVQRVHRTSTTDDCGLQTDGAGGSAETADEYRSRESLFPVESDYSSDESTVQPSDSREIYGN